MQQLQFKVILLSIAEWYLLCSKITCRKAVGQDRYLTMSNMQRPKPDSRQIIKEFYFKLNECAEQMLLIIFDMIGWIITWWDFKTCKTDHNMLFLWNSIQFFLVQKGPKNSALYILVILWCLLWPSEDTHKKSEASRPKSVSNILTYIDYTLQKPYIGTII